MKKLNSILMLAIMAIAVFSFSSCGSDDEDYPTPVPPTPTYSFVAPYMDWDGGLTEIRAYMATKLPEYKEDSETYTDYNGTHYTFDHPSGSISYTYTIKKDKFTSSSISYFGMNDKFNNFKDDVTKACGITEWKEQESSGGINWWTATMKGKKTDVAIGNSTNYGGYMYVNFQYTEFDW